MLRIKLIALHRQLEVSACVTKYTSTHSTIQVQFISPHWTESSQPPSVEPSASQPRLRCHSLYR